ncbi:MAG: HNH endonuclease signature motif containing protein [Rhodobacteraceae bacterium]|nr:HNH endonuclease signature motif containing protein [Paracoccaceae bacterium]MCY4138256.1 HNH endonuclease signature motif containing protein [Paracoccaceae bacterium]
MTHILIDNPDWDDGSWGGLERIEFDFENPQKFNSTQQFYERDDGTTVCLKYNVIADVGKPNELKIKYRKKDNRHLFEKDGFKNGDFFWGTHILTRAGKDDCGSSVWNGREGPGWKKEQIIGHRRRVTTTKLQRAQARFRKWLLNEDKRCAVSGELCPTVLDAAHIVSVSKGGQEVLANGFLLRTDLHRLYDADPPSFRICPETGKVSSSNNYDGFDFRNRTIPDSVRVRVCDALRARAE